MKFEHAFVIGVGGTGSHLIEPLTKLLHYHQNGTSNITVVDGDKYEESNLTRQLFDQRFLGQNKAAAVAERLNFCKISAVPQYVDGRKFKRLLQDKVSNKDTPILVITSVDNHATRNLIIRELDSGWMNFVLLSPGNDLTHGEMISYAKINGEMITGQHPFEDDSLKYPNDHVPGNGGCQEAAVSAPQHIMANAGAAMCCLMTVAAILDNETWFEKVHFDCRKMKFLGVLPVQTTTLVAVAQ